MSSYWWPLGRATATSAPPAATTTAASHVAAPSTASPSASSSSAADMRHLAQTAFHASLESLLVEATKHRSLLLLRDAVQDTRQRHYDPMSVFNTLCIACSLLAERSGTSGGRSFSNASSAAQAAAGGAIEGARMALRSGGESAKLAASLSSHPLVGLSSSAASAASGGALHSSSSSSSQALHYRHHGSARSLLLQSIGDVGKLIALGLLPVTMPVGQRVADLVREIAFLPSSMAAAEHRTHSPHSVPRASAILTTSPTSTAAPLSSAHDLHAPREKDNAEAPSMGPVQLVHDEPVLVRLLQLTASAASACPLGSPALPDLYGVLILFYSGVAPQSMLEATCEATLTHHIHTVLATLRDNKGSLGEGGQGVSAAGAMSSETSPSSAAASPFTAQLHGIAFMKDICRLMMGARTRWLQLSQRRSGVQKDVRGEEGTTSARHALATRRANSASSSMAAVAASVVAAAANAERQQQQQQLRSPQTTSLSATPVYTAIASANQDVSVASFGSPMLVGGAGGGACLMDSPSSSVFAPASGGGAVQTSTMEYVPEHLRAFLMRALTLFFKEQKNDSTAPSPPPRASTHTGNEGGSEALDPSLDDSPLYVQCLNDCLFSVALWGMYEMDITVPMQPPPSLFVEVMQQQYTTSHSTFVCSLDLFTSTQQLALITLSTNLKSMSNSAQILMEAHERLLQRLYRTQTMRGASRSPVRGEGGVDVLDVYAERLSQAAVAVLTLWRKTLTSTSLLWELQQLRSARAAAASSTPAFTNADGVPSSLLLQRSCVATPGDRAGASTSFFNEHLRQSSDDSSAREFDSDSDEGNVEYRQRGHRRRGQSADEDALSGEEAMGGQISLGGSTSSNNNPNAEDRQRDETASPVRRVRFRHRPQPLQLARPQPLQLARPQAAFLDANDGGGVVDGDSYEDNSREEEEDGVGSPRSEMPPLARLVAAVLNLVMAYMQTSPARTRSRMPPSPGEASTHATAAAAATMSTSVTLLSVTPPRDSEDLLEQPGELAVHDAAPPPPSRKKRTRRTPALPVCLSALPHTVYQSLTEAINFLTVLGQYLCQLVEKQCGALAADGVEAGEWVTKDASVRRCYTWFLSLHPYLFRCAALCLRYLRYEEDVLPVVLKGIGYWVQVSCAMKLTAQRDAYLSLLVRALRMPDPVVGHLIALSPPTTTTSSSTSSAAASGNPAATAASGAPPKASPADLASLLVLHDYYATREPIVPGSVAAAALSGENIGDFRDASPAGHGRGSGTASRHGSSAGMSSWGIEWLRRRGRSASRSGRATMDPRTVSPSKSAAHGGSRTSSAVIGGSGDGARGTHGEVQGARTTAMSTTTTTAAATAPSAAALASLGWRAPAVQHVVVLGVCRLQHKILIMKTLHVIANALGAALDGGWGLLARGTALTEPLLHVLKRLLSWIEETSVEHEQQEQLLSDALHLRDALRSLCMNNSCRLPYAQLNVFFSGLVNGTASLSPSAHEVKKAAGIVMSGHSWSPAFDDDEGADSANGFGFSLDKLYDLPASAPPYTLAYTRLPRHDPQGCADQWVLTSECLCLSLLAMLPFTDHHNADVSLAAPSAGTADTSATASAKQQLLQRQRSGALMRALRLWQLVMDMSRYVTDQQRVVHWGITLMTSAAAHRRVLLTCLPKTHRRLRDGSASVAGRPGEDSDGFPPLSPPLEEELHVMEQTLTTITGHVAAVAAHLCRSAARRRSAAERDGAAAAAGMSGSNTISNTASSMSARDSAIGGRYPRSAAGGTNSGGSSSSNIPAVSFQAIQSAALVLTSGPFATVPLIQTANALFANSAAAASPTPTARDPHLPNTNNSSNIAASLLPFVLADASLSTASMMYSLQRAVHTSSTFSTHGVRPNDVGTYGGQSSANSGVSATVLDPLEQLLASPFALLEDVYQQWSCAQPAQREKESGKDATLREAVATDSAAVQSGQQVHEETEEMEHSIDDSPPISPATHLVSTTPEAAAAVTVVAEAVPHLLKNAGTAVLMDVVKVVQAYGEDIDGAAWEPILSLLQRTATLGAVAANAATAVPGMDSTRAGGPKALKADGSASSAQTVESLNTAFRALESIQHNHIPRLKGEGLHRLIVCIGAFTVHRVDGGVPGERKLHINLSAVQLLWSTADYLAAFGGGAAAAVAVAAGRQNGSPVVGGQVGGNLHIARSGGVVDAPKISGEGDAEWGTASAHFTQTQQQQQQQQDRLWCSLLWQLRSGCLDDRQEIRQSAMQTLFALVQTYGWRFSGACWRCVLQDVLLPLIDVVSAATVLCATPAPQQQQQPASTDTAATASVSLSNATPAAAPISTNAPTAAASTSAASSSDPVVQRLLEDLTNQPAQLEEARVTLYDAGSRLFVTHYANMQAALQGSAQPISPVFRSSGSSSPNTYSAGEATRALEALLRLCGDVCVVVRGTTGELSAMAAVHALHGLLVELPGNGLHPFGVHLAWRSMERLLSRGDGPMERAEIGELPRNPAAASGESPRRAPYAHTEAKQCTLSVVAAIVAAVCDSFRLQRMVAAAAAAGAATLTATAVGGDQLHGATASGDAQTLATADRTTSTHGGSGSGISSYFTGWGSQPGSPIIGTGRAALTPPEAQWSSPGQYFTRLLVVLQAVTTCNAVVTSYYFPSKPQTTLLEGVTAVWPTLTSREARMLWGEVVLPAFPTTEDVQRFVLQDSDSASLEATNSNTATAVAAPSQLIALKTVMPPGSHPSYLSAVMDTMRSLLLLHMGMEPAAAASASSAAGNAEASASAGTEEDRTRLLFMAPSTVYVTGTLLLLHLASPVVLAGPPRAGGVPFTLPALFLQECGDLLQFALWGPVLSQAPVASGRVDEAPKRSGAGGLTLDARQVSSLAVDGSLPAVAAATRCRREGVATLCRVFECLLAATSVVVRGLDATSRASARLSTAAPAVALTTTTITTTTVPPYVTAALQSLDRLVDTLGEVVRLVMEQYDDVESATEAINVLSAASTAEGMALARVAKRSLSLLQRWADAVVVVGAAGPVVSQRHPRSGSSESGAISPLSHSGRPDERLSSSGHHPSEGLASRSQLQDVVRASMEARNKAIMKQYIDNPDDVSAGALLIDTLRDVLRVAQNGLAHGGSGDDKGGSSVSSEQEESIMPELLQLVACCSAEVNRSTAAMTREREVREVLSSILSTLYVQRRQRGLAPSLSRHAASHGPPRAPAGPPQRKRTPATETEEAMSII